MPFDAASFNSILREVYGERITELLYDENSAGPLHRIARATTFEGAIYQVPIILGLEQPESSPLIPQEFQEVKFDEEWI